MLLVNSSKRIATQIIILLAISSFVALAGIASIYFVMLPEFELSPKATRTAASIIAVLRGLEALPPSSRPQLLSAYKDSEVAASILDRQPELAVRYRAGLGAPARVVQPPDASWHPNPHDLVQ